MSSSILDFLLAPVSNESNPYITTGSWQFHALCMADYCENDLWTKYIVNLSLQHFVPRIPTVNTRLYYASFYVYSFLGALTFWNTFWILKEASLIETENYPCHNNRAGVETGNNGMSGDSFWVPESSDINFLLFLYQADILNDGNYRWLDPTEDGVQWLSTIQHLTMHRLRFHTWHLTCNHCSEITGSYSESC